MVQCANKSVQSTLSFSHFWCLEAKIGIVYTLLMSIQENSKWRAMYNTVNLAKQGISTSAIEQCSSREKCVVYIMCDRINPSRPRH